MKWRALYLVIFFLSRSYIYTYKKTREKERNREKGRNQERKREKGRENEVNYYQSAFNSQKEKLIYWQKCSKSQKVAVSIYNRPPSL